MFEWLLQHEGSMRDVNGSYRRSTATATTTTAATYELRCRLLEPPIYLPRMQCVRILRHLLQQYAVVLRRELPYGAIVL